MQRGIGSAGELLAGDGGQYTDGRARRKPARDLSGAKNRGCIRVIDEVADGRTDGPRTNPPRIEEVRFFRNEIGAGQEEGTLLGEERFECREIDRGQSPA